MTTIHVATNRKSLFIKEVAQLVGVSTKTVRHYHKIGLLPEPERTKSDYRLYSGWDLWRLRTICELRRLGLSLDRIRTVLEAPKPADALRMILATQLDELETEMLELAERKERIQRLMSQDHISVDLVNGEPDLYTDKILAQYKHLLPDDIDESLVQFEREFESVMAAFPKKDGSIDVYPQGAALIEENPDAYQQFIQSMNRIWTKVSTFKILDTDAEKKIASLVDTFVEENGGFLEAIAQLSSKSQEDRPTDAVINEMVSEKMAASLTQSQVYLMTRLGAAADEMRVK